MVVLENDLYPWFQGIGSLKQKGEEIELINVVKNHIRYIKFSGKESLCG